MTSRRAAVILCVALVALPAGARGQSPACNQAREIVEQVKAMYASGRPDHARALGMLATAHDLCPALGEAWKYAACSATAMGDEQRARVYRGRAIFNGIADPDCGGAPSAVAPPGPVRRKHALVVGVGTFADPHISRLQFAAKDARDFAAVLRDPRWGRFAPEDVILLTDEQATRANILNALQEIAVKAREDDLVVIFVSTHGSPGREGSGLEAVGYIVTHDASLDNVWVDGLDFQDFAKKVTLLPARRRAVFLDTCYSGQVGPGGKALSIGGGITEQTAAMFLSGEGTYLVTSSAARERSWESETVRNGYFTHFLIEALKRGPEPPTLKQVFEHLARQVPEAVARDKRAAQNPQISPQTGPMDLRIGVVVRP